MSLHTPTNPEVNARIKSQKRNTTITSIIIALLVCALIVAILFFISIAGLFKNTDELVTYSVANDSTEEIVKPEMTNEVMKKPSAPSSSISKVIASTTPSPTAVPVPDTITTEPSLDFGDGDDFGDGWGNGNGNGSGGGGISTPFGRTGGDGMKGSFYDLKQTQKKSGTSLGKYFNKNASFGKRIPYYIDEVKSLNRGRYSNARMGKYYKASQELTFTHLVVPKTNADAAPKAFGVEKEVQPSGWLVVYEGILETTPSREVYFVGRYDDLLLVFINNKIVFDGSWSDHSGEFNKGKDLPGESLIHNTMRQSELVELKSGDKIRIVIGESPGGHVGGGLFVEEKGKEYKKNKSGHNILPPFATEQPTLEEIQRLRNIKYPIEVSDIPIFKVK